MKITRGSEVVLVCQSLRLLPEDPLVSVPCHFFFSTMQLTNEHAQDSQIFHPEEFCPVRSISRIQSVNSLAPNF
jgi:hypothetical protein